MGLPTNSLSLNGTSGPLHAAITTSTPNVMTEFNTLVNMELDELKEWLTSESSLRAGWPKHDDSGETIGHGSGRHIVEILSKNPTRDLEKYDEDDIAHMRKVVSYCKRHLAQEEKAKQNPNSKSARSLKNWGHDPQKEEGSSE
ncbi:hypothetical protein L211DRAFT_852819 [Terfezia boudieri ATCC MYA-4762]|uniref:DNA-binding protein n=1 Tax=Terfezia boudieri ATCC MYA-4762 TaxID=1051890 RepID=A0A3N4LA92_9PEZI|nr:hypothetical protein L211DRAFT_852819 [Terfezia boudieri ATCC MYA-4762]